MRWEDSLRIADLFCISMLFISKPHPFIYNRASILLPGILTFLLIAIIAPFEFQRLDLEPRLFFALILGGVCSLSIILTVNILRKTFPSYMDQERWTTGKEIVLFLVVISVMCISVFLILFGFDLTSSPPFELFKSVVFNTLSIAIFPIIILVLYEQYNHQKKQLVRAKEMNALLSQASEKSVELIQLMGENGKLELQLVPEELIFLKSEGNYVEVYYGIGQPEKKLIRNRLKSLGKQLPNGWFIQCHKSYVVNKHSIVSVKGNARNFELQLRGVPDMIPVSRSKSEELRSFLSA